MRGVMRQGGRSQHRRALDIGQHAVLAANHGGHREMAHGTIDVDRAKRVLPTVAFGNSRMLMGVMLMVMLPEL